MAASTPATAFHLTEVSGINSDPSGSQKTDSCAEGLRAFSAGLTILLTSHFILCLRSISKPQLNTKNVLSGFLSNAQRFFYTTTTIKNVTVTGNKVEICCTSMGETSGHTWTLLFNKQQIEQIQTQVLKPEQLRAMHARKTEEDEPKARSLCFQGLAPSVNWKESL